MTVAFLGVESSFSSRKWVARSYDERQALALAQRYELPDALARALSARCVDVEGCASFLDPRLRDLIPDPSRLKDMDAAVSRFILALTRHEKITVFGDYDVDGATSSALIVRYAHALGRKIDLYIPDRLTEGYGPNVVAMQKLAEEGAKLVLCVDCGITAHEPLAAAKKAGLDVIVIDHHAAEPTLPPAVALVNPNRLDEEMTAELGALAAVGVTYLFIIAINRALREVRFFGGEHHEPDLLALLDLVALGTVCDVVKLTGLNRAFVAQGLKVMQRRGNVGLSALARASGVIDSFDTYTAGFVLGPRVNAGGRVGRSDVGARLLSSFDEKEVVGWAEQLNVWNHERRAIEAEVLAQAELMVFEDDSPLTFVASAEWHPGVIGIVASRLKDKFHRPAIVIALENGIGKGSGRSVGTIDLGANVIAARQAGLLINGGGHKMAAGLTVAQENLEELRAFLTERIGRQLAAEPFVPTLSLDGLLSPAGMTLAFLEQLQRLAPFGTGNAEPRFALADVKIVKADVVGERHVKIIATQGTSRVEGIAFRAMESTLGAGLLSRLGQTCHLAGRLKLNEWQGRQSVQLMIDDAAI
ncbi:MAG: single-stranded-DNA-specific exonuclease RecJ [Proteobacteria bacterium]|nr:single-stranded-DNA-specific exonuclease RecJ [Alphaproteobacteria bacterium]NCC02793.1 single-stranded-DNA-specific exonuclease RecJ [Pseudomonadota bacterium]